MTNPHDSDTGDVLVLRDDGATLANFFRHGSAMQAVWTSAQHRRREPNQRSTHFAEQLHRLQRDVRASVQPGMRERAVLIFRLFHGAPPPKRRKRRGLSATPEPRS